MKSYECQICGQQLTDSQSIAPGQPGQEMARLRHLGSARLMIAHAPCRPSQLSQASAIYLAGSMQQLPLTAYRLRNSKFSSSILTSPRIIELPVALSNTASAIQREHQEKRAG